MKWTQMLDMKFILIIINQKLLTKIKASDILFVTITNKK